MKENVKVIKMLLILVEKLTNRSNKNMLPKPSFTLNSSEI